VRKHSCDIFRSTFASSCHLLMNFRSCAEHVDTGSCCSRLPIAIACYADDSSNGEAAMVRTARRGRWDSTQDKDCHSSPEAKCTRQEEHPSGTLVYRRLISSCSHTCARWQTASLKLSIQHDMPLLPQEPRFSLWCVLDKCGVMLYDRFIQIHIHLVFMTSHLHQSYTITKHKA
jgi:hypothetical protein